MDVATLRRELDSQRQVISQTTAALLGGEQDKASARLALAAAVLQPPLRSIHELESELARQCARPELARSAVGGHALALLQEVAQARAEFDALQAQLSRPEVPS